MRSINLNRGLSWERSVKCFDCTSQPARPIIISEYVTGQTLYHYPLVVNLSETESLLLTNGYRNLRLATRQRALANLNALERNIFELSADLCPWKSAHWGQLVAGHF